jgi:hypothetical protein
MGGLCSVVCVESEFELTITTDFFISLNQSEPARFSVCYNFVFSRVLRTKSKELEEWFDCHKRRNIHS